MQIYLNRDWIFNSNQKVTIPHTCKETPFHYFDESEYQMVCEYEKEIEVPETWKEKQVLLTFEGVAHLCEVFLNGVKIGEHKCGYTSFTLKLENLLYGKKNTLLVKVDSRESANVPPFGHVIDYMTYGGIYRDVYLEIKENTYIEDAFLYSDLKTLTAEITRNRDAADNTCKITLCKKGFTQGIELCQTTLQGVNFKHEVTLPKVELWSVDSPNLYDVKIELFEHEKLVDEKVIPFGFRTMEFKKDGFY